MKKTVISLDSWYFDSQYLSSVTSNAIMDSIQSFLRRSNVPYPAIWVGSMGAKKYACDAKKKPETQPQQESFYLRMFYMNDEFK